MAAQAPPGGEAGGAQLWAGCCRTTLPEKQGPLGWHTGTRASARGNHRPPKGQGVAQPALLNQGSEGSGARCDPDVHIGKKRTPAKSGEHGVANGARERVRSRWTQGVCTINLQLAPEVPPQSTFISSDFISATVIARAQSPTSRNSAGTWQSKHSSAPSTRATLRH